MSAPSAISGESGLRERPFAPKLISRNSARVPQIIKNYKEKSCEGEISLADLGEAAANRHAGLALLFFMLSLTGNLTYGISLVSYSQDKEYLIKTIPWLLGSLGTIVEDCVIFVQFRLYSKSSARAEATAEQ
jgi:hypothetical protein